MSIEIVRIYGGNYLRVEGNEFKCELAMTPMEMEQLVRDLIGAIGPRSKTFVVELGKEEGLELKEEDD